MELFQKVILALPVMMNVAYRPDEGSIVNTELMNRVSERTLLACAAKDISKVLSVSVGTVSVETRW